MLEQIVTASNNDDGNQEATVHVCTFCWVAIQCTTL